MPPGYEDGLVGFAHDDNFGFRFDIANRQSTYLSAIAQLSLDVRLKEAGNLMEAADGDQGNDATSRVKGIHTIRARLFQQALRKKKTQIKKTPKEFPSAHVDVKADDASDSGLSILTEDKEEVHKEKKKIDKSGFLWGCERKGEVKEGPGPADFNIKRYPFSVRDNVIPFNSAQVRKISKNNTPVAVYNLSKKKGTQCFNHSFGGKKELNIPKIICVSPVKDRCVKCKNEITHRYFYVFHKSFLCHLCRNKVMRGTNLNEKMKTLMFEEARYCVRYHDHENVKFFDKLIPNRDLYKILQKEVYLRNYLNRPSGIERVPSKKKWQTSTERSEIYESLVPHGNWKTKEGLCEYLLGGDDLFGMSLSPTLGAQMLIESVTGEKIHCTPDLGVCPDPFVFPGITSSTCLVNY